MRNEKTHLLKASYQLENAINQAQENAEKARIIFIIAFVLMMVSALLMIGMKYINSDVFSVLSGSPSLVLVLLIFLGSLYMTLVAYLHLRKSINDIDLGVFIKNKSNRVINNAY